MDPIWLEGNEIKDDAIIKHMPRIPNLQHRNNKSKNHLRKWKNTERERRESSKLERNTEREKKREIDE
jgi:hypothetical protein